jgi:carbohydrate-selective porin OprB
MGREEKRVAKDFARKIMPMVVLICLAAWPGLGQETGMGEQSRLLLTRLQDRGISFQVNLVQDWSKLLRRDEDAESGYGRYSLDLLAKVDTGKLFGLKGSEGAVRLKNHMEEFGWTCANAAQVYSNIDAPPRTTLYEMWLEQREWSDRLRIKAGKIDANTEFAVVETGGDFLNSSMGYSPTVMLFPTYPEPQPGARITFQVAPGYEVRGGIFRTISHEALWLLEPGHRWAIGQSELGGRASFGYWRIQGPVDRFDGARNSATQGYYAVAEQALWAGQTAARGGQRQLSVFLQGGYADGDVNAFIRHAGLGAALSAPWLRRKDDAVGMASSWTRFSRSALAGFENPAELVWETYYKMSFSRHFALVHDLQYLHDPGGKKADFFVFTPRFTLAF